MKTRMLATHVQPQRLMAVFFEPSAWAYVSFQRFSANSTLRAEMFGCDRHLSWMLRIGPIVMVGFRTSAEKEGSTR